MTSYHRWWGWSDKFWLAFYHLHDIRNIRTKFNNHRSGNERPIFSYSRGQERRENIKVASRSIDWFTILSLH